jgi:hypothetical protein
MVRRLCTTALIAILFSCQKSSHQPASKVDSNFYISFSTTDSNYSYREGISALYFRGGPDGSGVTSNGWYFWIDPSTYMSPLQGNSNTYLAGFYFDYYNVFGGYNFPYTDIGDTLLTAGTYGICNTGIDYALIGTFDFGCPLRTDVNIVMQPSSGTLYVTASSAQPIGTFFTIDSVSNVHYVDNDNLRDYDKIISGRFQCRVFNPADTSIHLDLTNGRFRMPVWRNQQD